MNDVFGKSWLVVAGCTSTVYIHRGHTIQLATVIIILDQQIEKNMAEKGNQNEWKCLNWFFKQLSAYSNIKLKIQHGINE